VINPLRVFAGIIAWLMFTAGVAMVYLSFQVQIAAVYAVIFLMIAAGLFWAIRVKA